MGLASANAGNSPRVRSERHLRLVPPLPPEPLSRSVPPVVGDPATPTFDDPSFPSLWPVPDPRRSAADPARPVSDRRRSASDPGWPASDPGWSIGNPARPLSDAGWSIGIPARSLDDGDWLVDALAPDGAEATQRPVGTARFRRSGRRPVRLTRRGRIVVGALLLAAVLGLLALLAPPTQAAPPAGPPRTVTVHSGDTLYSIATRADPSRPPYAVMADIRRLNHMTGTTVYAGQQLLLPAG